MIGIQSGWEALAAGAWFTGSVENLHYLIDMTHGRVVVAGYVNSDLRDWRIDPRDAS